MSGSGRNVQMEMVDMIEDHVTAVLATRTSYERGGVYPVCLGALGDALNWPVRWAVQDMLT